MNYYLCIDENNMIIEWGCHAQKNHIKPHQIRISEEIYGIGNLHRYLWVDGELAPRPEIKDLEIGTDLSKLPANTKIISRKNKEIPVEVPLTGYLELNEPGIYKFEITPPSPFLPKKQKIIIK